MLTPFARRVISRTRRLKRPRAFGAIARLTSGPSVKLNPRNFRCCGLATALFGLVHFELELLRDELRDALHHSLTGSLASHVDIAIICIAMGRGNAAEAIEHLRVVNGDTEVGS